MSRDSIIILLQCLVNRQRSIEQWDITELWFCLNSFLLSRVTLSKSSINDWYILLDCFFLIVLINIIICCYYHIFLVPIYMIRARESKPPSMIYYGIGSFIFISFIAPVFDPANTVHVWKPNIRPQQIIELVPT